MPPVTTTLLVTVVGWLLVQSLGVHGQDPVELMFQGVTYQDNSVLALNDIGAFSAGNAIICTTNRSPCCSTQPNRFGNWYYPNGTVVPNDATGYDFFRGRQDDQRIYLTRRNNAMSPTGSFCCELPDSSGVMHTRCVGLITVTVSIAPSVTSPTVGGQYTLTCTAVITADGLNPATTYQWFKGNTVISGETQSTFSISSLRLSDAGQYRCDVTVGQTVNEMSNTQDLTLQIPTPNTVTVTASPTGTINTGTTLTLTCNIQFSQNVDTELMVKTLWSGPPGGQITTAASTATRNGAITMYTSIATVSSVTTSDSGVYTCRASASSSSSFLTDSSERSGVANVNVRIPPPSSVTVTASPIGTINTGTTLTLTCTILFNQDVDIGWTVNTMWSGTQFTTSASTATRNNARSYTSIATVSSVTTSDSGVYTCRASVSSSSSSLIDSTERSGMVTVNVQIPPPSSVTVTASPTGTINTGTTVTLTCTILFSQNVNTILTVNTVWSGPSGGQLTTSASIATRNNIRMYTSTATVNSVTTSDAGVYTCRASASSSSSFLTDSDERSGVYNVIVQFPPPATVTVAASTGDIFIGSTVTLTCTITISQALDASMSVNARWSGPSGAQFTTTGAALRTALTYTSTARISSVMMSDFGIYTCTARITAISQFIADSVERSGMYTISEAPVPSTPINIMAAPQSTSITISWTQPTGGIVDNYEVTYFYTGPCQRTPGNTVTISGNLRQYSVAGLQEFGDYTITLRAINGAGRSELATTRVTTLPSRPTGVPQNLRVTSTNLFSTTIQWDEVECLDRNSLITGYSVRYEERPASMLGANSRMFTANGLVPSTRYTFEVAAVSNSGTGPYAVVNTRTSTPSAVSLLLNGPMLVNNSIVTLNEIGEDNAALYCLTNKTDCCRSSDTPAGVGDIGEWFFPDRSSVNDDGSGDDIYGSRGPTYVALNRRSNAQATDQGIFCCEVPDATGTNQELCIGVYPMNSGSPSITNLFYSRSTRTFTCTSTGGPATTVTWMHNSSRIIVDETNIQEQTIINAELGEYQNTLIINSDTLDDYVGSFTCSVSNLRGNSDNSIMIQAIQITGHEQPLTLGEPAAINCSSDLEVERIEWLNNANSQVVSNSGEQQLLLNFDRVDHTETGATYTCRIITRNPSGATTQLSVTLRVAIRNEPFPPENVVSSNLTSDSVKISWTVPIIASTLETYVVMYGIDNVNENGSMPQRSERGVEEYSVGLSGLSPSTKYRYVVRATNQHSSNDSAEMVFITTEQPTEKSALGTIVGAAAGTGVVVLILIIITVIVITVLVLWSRKSRNKYSPSSHRLYSSENSYSAPSIPLRGQKVELKEVEAKIPEEGNEDYFENVGALVHDHQQPIKIAEFEKHVKEMHKDRDKLFDDEYRSISSVPQSASNAAELPCNKQRNRFANIFPYDFSRVHLKKIPGEDAGSDYINANFINGYKRPKAYIAAQGPMPNTVNDFWRMIWEYKLPTVVMLTRCFEGRKKCEVYWPETRGETIEPVQNLQVTLKTLLPFAEYTIRKMSVKCSSEPDVPALEVTQFHFVGWPDHGVPNNAITLINFIRRVRKIHPFSDERHMLVHCSAGVGRTGTFIVLDSMLQRMKEEDSVNVYESVTELRKQRVLMVQTQAQYMFIHDALNELIICGDTEIGSANLRISINRLRKPDANKVTKFQKQFQNLDKVAVKVPDVNYSSANKECNVSKNRYRNKIPNDFTRVCLKLTGTPGSDYINASHIDGYRQRGTYIATQGPLESTVNDFWRMIWEQKSHCIVMLFSLQESETEPFHCYWPTNKEYGTMYGKIAVKLVSEENHRDYIIRKFELTEGKQQASASFSSTTLQVTQFQYVRWPEHSPPQKIDSLLDVIEKVNKVQMGSGNKAITVMCNDGVGRSGTFICIHSQLERLKTEGVVDFFQFIKAARIQRAGLVPEVSQYMFCHDVAASYLDKFDTYANFKF